MTIQEIDKELRLKHIAIIMNGNRRWAKEKGFKNFVLGGGYGADDGIFQYKANLAPHGVRNFYIGRKIFDKAVYQQLLSVRSKGNKDMENELISKSFFPAYRGG